MLWRSARYAFDTGEAIVSPISGASSLSAKAGTDAVTTFFRPAMIGPVWQTHPGNWVCRLTSRPWRVSPVTGIFSSNEARNST